MGGELALETGSRSCKRGVWKLTYLRRTTPLEKCLRLAKEGFSNTLISYGYTYAFPKIDCWLGGRLFYVLNLVSLLIVHEKVSPSFSNQLGNEEGIILFFIIYSYLKL